MADRFEDARGLIEDLLVEPLDSVTRIFTKAGAVRGNHIHRETTQFTYVVSGHLLVAARLLGAETIVRQVGPGELVAEAPGIAHAWKALEDCTCLVFTRGPRSGEGYEGDTERLAGKDKLL